MSTALLFNMSFIHSKRFTSLYVATSSGPIEISNGRHTLLYASDFTKIKKASAMH